MTEIIAPRPLEVELWRSIQGVNTEMGGMLSGVTPFDSEEFARIVLRHDALVEETCQRLGLVAPKDYKTLPDDAACTHFDDWYVAMEQIHNPQSLAE